MELVHEFMLILWSIRRQMYQFDDILNGLYNIETHRTCNFVEIGDVVIRFHQRSQRIFWAVRRLKALTASLWPSASKRGRSRKSKITWVQRFKKAWLPLEPKTFIFRGYNPYIGGLKLSFFMVLGSKGSWWFQPLWKISSSNWIIWDPRFGVNMTNIWVATT